jgi:peptidyl-prolyl cis-trans isomerase D
MNIMKLMRSSKWLYLLLWLVILSFIIWIFAYYGGGGRAVGNNLTEDYIVKVGGRKLPAKTLNLAMQMQREQIRNYLGEQYVEQFMKDAHKMITSGFVDSLIIEDIADKMGVGVKDYEIADRIEKMYQFTDPKTQYPLMLQSRGVSQQDFEAFMRISLVREKLTNLISQRYVMDENEAKKLYNEENTKFKAKIIYARNAIYNKEVGEIPESSVRELYEKEKSTLQLPERRSLKYIMVSMPVLRNSMEVSEEEMKNYYETNKTRFGEKPFEQVKNQVRNMLLFSDKKYQEKAKALLDVATQELEKAGSEEEIKAFADKYKLKIDTVDNMSLENAKPPFMTENEVKEEIFKAEKGKWSKAYKMQVGSVKFYITDIEPPRPATYDDVKDELKTRIRNEKLKEIGRRKIEELKATFKDPKTFEEEAKKLNFSVQDSSEITLNDALPSIGKDKDISLKIFESQLNALSGPYETKDGFALAILLEKKPADMEKFKTEKDDFINQKARQKADEYITDIVSIKRRELEEKKKIKINYEYLKQYEPAKEG